MNRLFKAAAPVSDSRKWPRGGVVFVIDAFVAASSAGG
ncbi:hypothetical protein SAMCCGM7_pB0191 (plasmid) [Sinorhizobium americanum CCGM7]|nr:hypothetical protein SAMCCGM7_pB0191 [Sinorhizobium americanum CCGM7]